MGFKVGIPILELKRGKKAAAKCKKGGDARSICVEAGEERYSRTKNYDPSRSGDNVHLGPYTSGEEAYEHILDEVARAEEIHRRKDARGRGFRKDATIAYAAIIKPEGEWINAQTPDDRLRFFADARRVLSDLGVMPEDETVMCELHRDEGYSADEPCDHLHIVCMAHTDDGDLAGSRHISRDTFPLLNREFPRRMQALGWDVEELVDEQRAAEREAYKKMTPEEQEAWREKRKKEGKRHGLDANAYADKCRRERANKAASAAIARAHDALSLAADAESRYDELVASAEADAQAVRAEAEAAAQAARDELAGMEPTIKAGRAEIASLDADKKAAEAEKKQAEKEAAEAKAEKARAFDAKLKAGRELSQTRVLVDRRKKELEELDERLAEAAKREAEAARKEAEAKAKLEDAARLFDAAETAQAEADAREADTLSRLVAWVGRLNPKWSRTLQGWVDGFKNAEAERKGPGRERVREGRRAVNTALLGRERGDENGYDF